MNIECDVAVLLAFLIGGIGGMLLEDWRQNRPTPPQVPGPTGAAKDGDAT